jgi:hypothetical protein
VDGPEAERAREVARAFHSCLRTLDVVDVVRSVLAARVLPLLG